MNDNAENIRVVDSLCRDDADMPNAAIHTKSLQPPHSLVMHTLASMIVVS